MATRHSKSTEETTELNMDGRPSTSGQPLSNAHGCDGVILKVAEALSNDSDLRRLGLELGVKNPDINRALETNWAGGVKTSNGNVVMLQNWAMTVKSSQQLPTLRGALKKAGLAEIEETCLPRSPTDEYDVVPDEILKLKKQLKRRYRKIYSKVKTSPIDPESRTWLQHIYVSLVLMFGSTQKKKESIDYEGLFQFIETETEEGFATRLSFIGEAGVGKSTLFAKIALDWAEGKILQEIDLLLLESFRDIEDSNYFGDIVMNHFPDATIIKGEQVDDYVKKKPRKVLILLDGLDEAKIDIKKSNRNSSVVSIIRGERFIDTPVLITTRPFGADQIKGVEKIHEQYNFIKVKGFTPENMSKYIKQFFKDDTDSAATLIRFVKQNKHVAEHMAPIPIFCCMLCYMWKTPSRRESLMKKRTMPQLLRHLVFSLQEQYCSKHNDAEGGYEVHRKKAVESMKDVGRVAFHGLLEKQLIFDKQAIGSEAGIIACEVGILTKEKRLAPMEMRESQGKQFIHEFSFPHKLLQEYTSSLYLASLFDDDRPEFNRILTDKLLTDYKEFRYVLYFTAARGREVGKSLMEALCQRVDDLDFIMEVAFECHDTGATIEPVRNLLNMTSHLRLGYLFKTTYFFTLETLGKEVMMKESSVVQPSDAGESFEDRASSSHAAAVGLFTLQNLRSLKIWRLHDDDFYKGMCDAASRSKIEELKHDNIIRLELGPAASSYYARGLFSMPHLRSLELKNVGLSDEFYSVMAEEASHSKIQTLSMIYITVTRRRLHAILSLPCLQSLSLTYVSSVYADDAQTLSPISSSVVELAVDVGHITSLWKFGLHTSCSRVRKFTLRLGHRDDLSSLFPMACFPFNHLTELHIEGCYRTRVTVSFCNAVITSCPDGLTKLSITRIDLYNEEASEIIQSMKTHPHLTDIQFIECNTDADLDPLIAEVNSEGKLTVTMKHGRGFSRKRLAELKQT